jgi:exosortase
MQTAPARVRMPRIGLIRWPRLDLLRPGAVQAVLGLALAWAYWPALCAMAERWSDDPQYSHGFLVPVFALVLLWSRRELRPLPPFQASWWGIAWLTGALLLRLSAGLFYLEPLDGYSLLLALAGVVLLMGGRPALRWAWPAIAFLGFMLPLPFQIDVALAYPLRRMATLASTYLLQTFGLPAFAEGNVIVMDGVRLEVVEACSGLGMLMTFFALATAVAVLVDRPPLDKLVVAASAIPIALLVNVVRITATALAHRWFGAETAHILKHDLAGWLMMPLALGLLWLELRLLSRLLPVYAEAGPLPMTLFTGPAAAPPAGPTPRARPGRTPAWIPPVPGAR